MKDRPLVSIGMPVFNPDHSFRVAVKSLLCQDFENWELLIIDDGSTIPVKIKSINPRVFQYILPFNVGLGLVTNIALDFAFSHNFDSLIRIDSDGQHPIKFIPSVLEPILMKEADLVITHRIYG